jgi:transcriptional regulator with PAS, ATPase and Fis domain
MDMLENSQSNNAGDCRVIIEISLESNSQHGGNDAISHMTGITGGSKLGSILCDFIHDNEDNNRLVFGKEIFGRDEELAMLWDAYDRVSAGPSEVILISGESGVGKSAIVETYRGPVTTTVCF